MKYKHIVFDVDGTLADTSKTAMESVQKMILDLTEKEIPLEELLPLFGMPCIDIAMMYGVPDPEYGVKLWQKYDHELQDQVVLFPGIIEMLDRLHKKGYKMGVVTSRDQAEMAQQLPHYGIDQYFDVRICVDMTEKGKPYPDPLYKYMELADAKPEEVIYIGDSKHDMGCALAAGTDSGLAKWGSPVNPEEVKCTYVFYKIEEILKLFDA